MDRPLEERVGINENELKNVKDLLLDLRDNHFKSLDEKVESLRAMMAHRLPVWATIIISLLSSSTIGLAVWGIMRKGGGV